MRAGNRLHNFYHRQPIQYPMITQGSVGLHVYFQPVEICYLQPFSQHAPPLFIPPYFHRDLSAQEGTARSLYLNF